MKFPIQLISLLFTIVLILSSNQQTSAKCVLCVLDGRCFTVNDQNCQDLNLAPSDICRDAVGILIETVSSIEVYAVIGDSKFRLASDEAQAKFDAILKKNKGQINMAELKSALAPIVAKNGKVSKLRIKSFSEKTTLPTKKR